MKKLTALLLVMTLIMSSISTVSAKTELEVPSIEYLKDGSCKLTDPTDSSTYVIGETLKNGNVVYTQYTNGVKQSKTIVKFDKKELETTLFPTKLNKRVDSNKFSKTGKSYGNIVITEEFPEVTITDEKTEIISVQQPDLKADLMQRSSSYNGYSGIVRYNYFDGSSSGVCGVIVSYVKNTGTKNYNVNTYWSNLATLAGSIAAAFSLGSALGLVVTSNFLTHIGVALSFSWMWIPVNNMQSNYTEVTWNLQDLDSISHRNSFSGTNYVITEQGSHFNKVYEEGTYYNTSAWGTTTFGMTVYSHMFAYNNYSIKQWY